MKEIITEIEIAAPKMRVWEILTDFNDWKNWNPIVNDSSGIAALGSKLSMTMSGSKGKDGPKYGPVITKIDETNSFRWRAVMMAGFLFTNDKVIELKETSAGTKLIHSEEFRGLLAPIFCGNMDKMLPPMLNKMNAALKEKAEKA